MKYNYQLTLLRFVLFMGLFGLVSVPGAWGQGLKNNTTYVINGATDVVAPIDTFPNLTGPAGALTYLNQFGMDINQTATGPVVFLLSAGYNPVEPSPLNIGNPTGAGGWPNMFWNASSPIILRPALGQNFTISTAGAIAGNGALVRFNAAWYFTIDGEAIPGQRNLTFNMSTNTQTTARVIDIIPTTGQRVQFVGIRNCRIIGGSTSSSIFTFAGIYMGGIAAASNSAIGQSQNVTITNNQIVGVANGIYIRGLGSAPNNQNRNFDISNNIIGEYVNPINPLVTGGIGGAANASGIYINAVANATVNGNQIRNTLLTSANFRGIFLNNEGGSPGLALDSNIQVLGNEIMNINTNTAGAGVTGIRVSLGAHTTPRRIVLANNSISRLSATNASSIVNGFAYPIGILIDNTTTDAGIEVFFNSVYLTGNTLPASSLSAVFATGPGTTGGIKLMNNSFANKMGRLTGNITGYSVYNLLLTGGYPFFFSSFNNYYTTTPDGGIAYIARVGATDFVSLKRYRIFSRSDSTSYSTIPPFRNDSDLTVATGSSHFTYNTGVSLTQFFNFYPTIFNAIFFKVDIDRFGTPRNNMGRFTSIGAHLWNGDSINNPAPLVGPRVFPINGFTSWPRALNLNGSFATVAEAVDYLNHYGVSGTGNIVLELQPGYAGETTSIPPVIDFPGAGIGTPVTLRTQDNFTTTVSLPDVASVNNNAVLKFIGTRWMTVTGGSNRGLTFSLPPLASNNNLNVISITPIDTNSTELTIMNCNIVGQSTTTTINTRYGIYVGLANGVGNVSQRNTSNLRFIGNSIGAVRTGIALFTPNSNASPSSGHLIKSNLIGGNIAPNGTANTNYIGGIANQYGIHIRALHNSVIDSNVIKNCIQTSNLSNGFAGIYLEEPAGLVSGSVEISRNSIYNLVTASGNNTIGIRAFMQPLQNPPPTPPLPTRVVNIVNNYIGRILGNGAGANFSNFNPAGIMVEGAAAVTDCGVKIAHNTVNLTGVGLANNGSSSACLYLNGNIRGGVESVNNLFVNRINRAAGTGNRYAVLVGHTTTPFTTANTLPFNSNNNNYYAFGAGNSFIGGANNGTVNYGNINEWRSFTSAGFPGMDGSSFSWPSVFLTDTTPNLSMIDGGLVPGGAAIISGLCSDIYGNQRYLCSGGSTTVLRWVGCLESGTPYPALQGNVTYPINGVDDPPTPLRPNSGSFKTVRAAVNYLNSQGVDDPNFGGSRIVRLEIQNGYIGETDSFFMPITIYDYPRMAVTRPVILSVASGRNDTIKVTGTVNPVFNTNMSLIRFAGCRFFTIDGNNGSNGKGLTLTLPASLTATTNRVVDFISGVNTVSSTNPSTQSNALRNCNIVGLSSTSAPFTFAGVYFGGAVAPSAAITGLNNNNVIDNNFIGATQYGVYLRGATTPGTFDNGNQITNNIIGGDIAPGGPANTNYYGGISNAAGVFVMGQIFGNIGGNTIKNSIQTAASPRGIELGVIAGNTPVMSSYIDIQGNTIRNIGTTANSGAYGIFLDFGNSNQNVDRNLNIFNNMISGIFSGGSTRTTNFAANPYGIYFNATANIGNTNTNVGVNLYYNSINLGQASTLTASNAVSACVGIPSFIQTGVRMVNNLFQNRLGAAATPANNYAVAIGGANSPFVESNFNNYFTSNQGTSVAANFASNVASATPVAYNQWFEIMTFTRQDTMSLTFAVPFTNDNNLFIPANTTSNLYQAGKPILGYSTDITGSARNFFIPSMGAHEFSGNYLDNVSPRVFNVTDPTICQAGTITLRFNIYDKQLGGDTLYYRLNGGTVQAIQATVSGATLREYQIPQQASGTIIEYRVVGRDLAPVANVGAFPTNKIWDTLSTGINVFPYTNGFEGVNNPAWTVQTINGNGNWELGATGSNINPPQAARSGLRSALFRSSVMTNGAAARLVSPCLDLSAMKSPTLRFFVSQNSDLPAKRDSINITISYGNNIWSGNLKTVERVNTDFPLPGYRMFEVCLAQHNQAGVRIGIEGYSTGNGQNIQIDDITIFDDAQNQTFTPKVFNQCYRDSVLVTITNSDTRFEYRAFQLGAGTLSTRNGNGSTLTMGIAVPSGADTLRYGVEAMNLSSAANNTGFGGGFITCKNVMPDSVTAIINRYTSNPLIQPGAPFNGSFNTGNSNVPDGARIGDTLTYRIMPPSFYTNANFGTLWTITGISAYREGSGLPITNFTYVAPTPSANGFVRYIAPAAYLDSNIVFNFGFRLLGSNCDTTVTRVMRVVNPATACFTITPPTNLCANNPIQFSGLCSNPKPANGFPFTFTFNYGDGTFAFQEVPQPKQYTTPGTYTVRYTITDRFGISAEQVQTITILPSPTIDFTVTNPCATDSTVFTPTAQTAGTTYQWSFHNNSQQFREVAKFAYPKFDTAYAVSVKVTNTSGCFATASKNVYIFARPTANFSSTAHCMGVNVPITNSSAIASGIMGYTWDWGNGQTSLSAVPTYKYPASGTYSVKLRVTSAFGCLDSTIKPVTVYDRPFAGFTYVSACVGDATQFTNTTTYAGGIPNVNFTWNFDDLSPVSNDPNPAHRFLSVTDDLSPRQVTLLAVDKVNGCRDSVLRNIDVNNKPVAGFGMPSSVCEGSSADVVNTSYTLDGETYSCLWNWGNGQTDSICNVTSKTYPGHGFYTVNLIITTKSGCSDTATQAVTVNLPEDNVLSEQIINEAQFPYCQNMRRLTASVNNAQDYTWLMGDKFSSTRSGQITEFVFQDSGTFNVKCVVKDASGCTLNDSISVYVYCNVSTEEALAGNFNLNAYPNPFQNGTNLSFELPKSAKVKVTTLDMLGRSIKTADLGTLAGGKREVSLDDTFFGASGAYMIKVEIDDKAVYQQLIKQ